MYSGTFYRKMVITDIGHSDGNCVPLHADTLLYSNEAEFIQYLFSVENKQFTSQFYITLKYKMKNSCPQWDSNPEPSAYKANALPIAPRCL